MSKQPPKKPEVSTKEQESARANREAFRKARLEELRKPSQIQTRTEDRESKLANYFKNNGLKSKVHERIKDPSSDRFEKLSSVLASVALGLNSGQTGIFKDLAKVQDKLSKVLSELESSGKKDAYLSKLINQMSQLAKLSTKLTNKGSLTSNQYDKYDELFRKVVAAINGLAQGSTPSASKTTKSGTTIGEEVSSSLSTRLFKSVEKKLSGMLDSSEEIENLTKEHSKTFKNLTKYFENQGYIEQEQKELRKQIQEDHKETAKNILALKKDLLHNQFEMDKLIRDRRSKIPHKVLQKTSESSDLLNAFGPAGVLANLGIKGVFKAVDTVKNYRNSKREDKEKKALDELTIMELQSSKLDSIKELLQEQVNKLNDQEKVLLEQVKLLNSEQSVEPDEDPQLKELRLQRAILRDMLKSTENGAKISSKTLETSLDSLTFSKTSSSKELKLLSKIESDLPNQSSLLDNLLGGNRKDKNKPKGGKRGLNFGGLLSAGAGVLGLLKGSLPTFLLSMLITSAIDNLSDDPEAERLVGGEKPDKGFSDYLLDKDSGATPVTVPQPKPDVQPLAEKEDKQQSIITNKKVPLGFEKDSYYNYIKPPEKPKPPKEPKPPQPSIISKETSSGFETKETDKILEIRRQEQYKKDLEKYEKELAEYNTAKQVEAIKSIDPPIVNVDVNVDGKPTANKESEKFKGSKAIQGGSKDSKEPKKADGEKTEEPKKTKDVKPITTDSSKQVSASVVNTTNLKSYSPSSVYGDRDSSRVKHSDISNVFGDDVISSAYSNKVWLTNQELSTIGKNKDAIKRRPEKLDAATAKAITSVAMSEGVDPEYMKRLAVLESSGNPYAVSPTGASGLFQQVDSTAKALGITNRFDPVQSAKGAAAHIKLDAQRLQKENLPINKTNLYMMYHLGPTTALKMIKKAQGDKSVSLNKEDKERLARNFGDKLTTKQYFDTVSSKFSESYKVADLGESTPVASNGGLFSDIAGMFSNMNLSGAGITDSMNKALSMENNAKNKSFQSAPKPVQVGPSQAPFLDYYMNAPASSARSSSQPYSRVTVSKADEILAAKDQEERSTQTASKTTSSMSKASLEEAPFYIDDLGLMILNRGYIG